MANKLALDVEKLLSKEVGEFVARAAVKKNCELIGTTPDGLTVDQLPKLTKKIETSVVFLSGKEANSGLMEKIAALSA